MESVLKKLEDIRKLELNCDRYDTLPINNKCIFNTKFILNSVKLFDNYFNPDIYPNTNGTISLEWDNKKESIYLEIGDSEYIHIQTYNNGEDHIILKGDFSIINLILHCLEIYFTGKNSLIKE